MSTEIFARRRWHQRDWWRGTGYLYDQLAVLGRIRGQGMANTLFRMELCAQK
jgi:hypothetical protein